MSDAPTIIIPTSQTLAKYGLSRDDWFSLVARANGRCEVCGKVPPSGRLVIDHRHVKGFKNMPPEERRTHIRGLLDVYCNAYIIARNSLATLEGAVVYLRRHELAS